MDSFEVVSNCSQSSRNSSDLSSYQNEFSQLRNLMLKSPSEDSNYEHVQNITTQLQSSLKQNEKYKNDIYNLEKRVQLVSNEKIESLLKRNNYLESSLHVANGQIKRLIDNYSIKDNNQSEISNLKERIFQIEKNNQELRSENFLLLNERNNLSQQNSHYENEQKALRIELNDSKVDLSIRINCITELKAKILEQHVSLQESLQTSSKISHYNESLMNDLKSVEKSENWYKEQLHHCQAEKIKLNKENVSNKEEILLKNQELEENKLELNKWKCKCDEIKLQAMKEKENILKHIENFKNIPGIDIEIFNYQTTIQDLSDEVVKIKLMWKEQEHKLKKSNKNNTKLLSKFLCLQNELERKEIRIEELENDRKALNMKLALSFDEANEKNQNILNYQSTIASLKTELSLNKAETDLIEKSIKLVKEQFRIFKHNYDCVKEELNRKNTEFLQFQVEQQKHFMENNWKHCESTKEKETIIHEMNALKLERIKFLHEIESLNLKQKNPIQGSKHDHHNFIQKLFNENYENVANFMMNNYANFDNVNITALLEYICKICKTDDDGDVSLLKNIAKYFKDLQTKNNSQEGLIKKLTAKLRIRGDFQSKIEKLEDRYRALKRKSDENSTLLLDFVGRINCEKNGEVKHLQALIEVNRREQAEKQKRYETNNRTLLRKVKEHMRARTIADKHNTHWQQLNNSLTEECNALKLEIDRKNSKLDVLNQHTKSTIDYEVERKRSEEYLKNAEETKAACHKELSVKQEFIDVLTQQNLDLNLHITNLETERNHNVNQINTNSETIKELNDKLINLQNKVEQLENDLSQGKEIIFKITIDKDHIFKQSEQLQQQNDFLQREIMFVNGALLEKSEEMSILQQKLNEANERAIIVDSLRNKLSIVENEKFFLQRFSKDLRMALKIHTNHNKVLKEQLANIQEKQEFSSISVLPASKYDDVYIDRLLLENRIPSGRECFSDVQGCLDTLRNEIIVLQQQILEKNAS